MATVPDRVLARAAAKYGEDGPRWSAPLDVPQESRESDPWMSDFGFSGNSILAPFDTWLLSRNLQDGSIAARGLEFPARIDQVVVPRNGQMAAVSLEARNGFISGVVLLSRDGKIRELGGHLEVPWRIVFSPDASRLLTCSDDATYRLWDTQTAKEISHFSGLSLYRGPFADEGAHLRGEFAAFAPSGKYVATVCGGEYEANRMVVLWSAVDGTLLSKRTIDGMQLDVLRVSPSGDVFAFGPTGGIVGRAPRCFQLKVDQDHGKFTDTLTFQNDRVARDGLFTPDGKYLVTWNPGLSELIVWDVATRTEAKLLRMPPRGPFDVVISPRGRLLAAISRGEVTFWECDGWSPLRTDVNYHQVNGSRVQFAPDGRSLVMTSSLGGIAVWDAP